MSLYVPFYDETADYNIAFTKKKEGGNGPFDNRTIIPPSPRTLELYNTSTAAATATQKKTIV